MKSGLRKKILQKFEGEAEFLQANGFDDALIGVDEESMRLIYSVSKCIEILMRDMSEEDALEYFSFNVVRSSDGKTTPIWCYDNYE